MLNSCKIYIYTGTSIGIFFQGDLEPQEKSKIK
jgi:hypothetical protein